MRTLGAVITLVAACGLGSACSSKKAPPEKREPADVTTVADAGVARPATAEFVRYATAAEAVQALMARRPRVVGFGEFHATVDGPAVVPSLARFRNEIFPSIAGLLSDLVVETYVEPSGCSAAAAKVAANIKTDMKRPEETETDVFALLRVARERKLGAHILEMSCADYESLRSAGQVDYTKTLGIITARLRAAIDKPLKTESPAAIAVYGGTMHNDLHPLELFADFSYATALATEVKYIEIDLFVPELIADSKLFVGQPWFEIAKREASPDHVVVIPRGPASYVVVLRSGVKLKPTP